MGYGEARGKLHDYRSSRISALLGESAGRWFTDLCASVGDMLASFTSDAENKAVASGYASDPSVAKAGPNIRLDYVCGLRREVRKQYVSGEGDVCTDVTPFRHGVMSAHGAQLFDDLMDAVVDHSERQARGVVA
jgi:hypothetical protein